jgi:hypothetical protein
MRPFADSSGDLELIVDDVKKSGNDPSSFISAVRRSSG